MPKTDGFRLEQAAYLVLAVGTLLTGGYEIEAIGDTVQDAGVILEEEPGLPAPGSVPYVSPLKQDRDERKTYRQLGW